MKKPELSKVRMANQFKVDQSKDFASKMTLITDVSSEKYLKQYHQHLQNQAQLESIYKEN
jgi:hypothetical protein